MKDFPGLGAFADEAAGELGHADNENERPVLAAKSVRPLRLLENQISQAVLASHPSHRDGVLAHCREHLHALQVSALAAVKMVKTAYDLAGLPYPAWLQKAAGATDEKAVVLTEDDLSAVVDEEHQQAMVAFSPPALTRLREAAGIPEAYALVLDSPAPWYSGPPAPEPVPEAPPAPAEAATDAPSDL